MSTFEATLEQLPKPILDKLQSIIWRVRRLLFVRGIFATLAVGLLCLLAIMAIDASITIFSGAIRWGMSIAGLLITAFAGWWFLVRPLSRKLSLTHVARILEVRHPELQERISTAVELLSSEDPEEIKGSEELIRAVVDSAVLDVESVDPRREFKGGRAAKFVKLSALCLAALAAVLLVFPNQGWKLLARALAPFSNIGNAYADTMVVSPGDVRIAKGSELTILMTVRHDKIRRAELRRSLANGTESVERMTLMGKTEDGAQKFSLTFPAVQESFNYRVRAGAALSKFFQVEAIPAPVVEKRTIRYDYPEYTQLPSAEEESASGEIRAVANTAITITSLINKEVWKANTILNDAAELGDTHIEGNVVTNRFTLKNGTNGTWRLDLEDSDSFTNERTPFPVQALPDRAPVVRITNPVARELRLKPVEVLPMDYEVNEDFGFSEVAILVTPNGESNPRVIAQPTPEGNEGTWLGKASLNLASLDLEPHQNTLQVQIRARDNRPESYDGPGEGVSETITILIDRNAKSLAEQTIDAQKRELSDAIREAKNELERAKNDIKNAERELAKKDEITPEAERELDRFRDQAKEAEETLKNVAEKLEDSVFKPQAKALEDIAKDEIAKAKESADLIPVTDEKKERIEEAQKARDQVEKALDDLAQVEKAIGESEDDLKAIAQLNELANDQRELARDASKQAEQQERQQQQNAAANEQQQKEAQQQQEQAMNEFQRRQEDVQKDLGEMLKDNASALQDILEKEQDKARALAEEARELAKSQEELRKMTEDAAASQQNPEQEAALQEQIMNQLQKMQEQIAQDTREVQKDLAKAENKPSEKPTPQDQAKANDPQSAQPPSLEKAAEQTQNVAESLARENLDQAAEAAKEAGQALAEAAKQAADPQAEAKAQEAGQPEGQETAQGEKGSEPSTPESAEGQPEGKEMAQGEKGSEPSTPESAQGQPKGEPQMAENSKGGEPQSGESAKGEPKAPETAQGQAPSKPTPAMQAAAEALSDLAERQEAIAEQIAAVQAGDLQEALAKMEAQLAAESGDLQAEAQALEEALDNLDQKQSRYEANHASNFLNSAANQAQQAQQDLAQAQQAQSRAESQGQVPEGQTSPQAQQAMAQSQQDQQQAQRSMETAAQSLEKAGEAIARTMEGLKPSEGDERLGDSQQMAESFEELSQSAQSQNAQQAAERSQQAANSLQQLAQQAMEQLGSMGPPQPGQPGQPGQQPSQPGQQPSQPGQPMTQEGTKPNEGGRMADANGDGVPPELKELGITAKDWARFKGTLTGGSANAIDTNLPSEYRELVGRYFQVIAKEAGGK